MPYLSSQSEIKLFYQVYAGNNPKPKDAILLTIDSDQMFAQDLIDDLVEKGIWNETLETQLENKQLYFKVFRDDEEMVLVDAILFDNIRMLSNCGLLSLEEPLKNGISNSMEWLGSFVPKSIKQSVYNLGNSIAKWTEDKLTGLSTYSSIPKVKEVDEEVWHKILEENSISVEPQSMGSTGAAIQSLNQDSASPSSFLESLLTTAWNCAAYAINHPFQTITLMLATQALVLRSMPTTPRFSKFSYLKSQNKTKIENNFFSSSILSTLTTQTTLVYGTSLILHGRQHATTTFTLLNLASLFSSVAAQPWDAVYPTPYNFTNFYTHPGGVKFFGDTGETIGSSISAIGDVNGDGKSDLLIGALNGNTNTGVVYLIYGGYWLNTPTFSLANLDGTNGVKIIGIPQGVSSITLSDAGDVNGDGKSDFLIGDPYANNYNGVVYLIYGGAWLNTPTFSLDNLNGVNGLKLVISGGIGTYTYLGAYLSSAGDVNGDGRGDFLIRGADGGSSYSESVYLIYGGPWLNTPTFSLANLDGTNGVKFVGDTFRTFGSAGDVNGDTKSDFLIGSWGLGTIYLIYGGSWLNVANFSLATLNGTTGVKIVGVSDFVALSPAGDINQDGKSDFLIGSPYADSQTGALYLVYGGSWLNTPTYSLANLNGTTGVKLLGVSVGDLTGFSVTSTGDFNGDGKPDFLIGSPVGLGMGPSRSVSIVYLVYGGPWLNTSTFLLASLNGMNGVKFLGSLNNGYNDFTGMSVSASGDINGDGVADFLAGSYSNGVYLVYGFNVVLEYNKLRISRADTMPLNSTWLNCKGLNPVNLILSPNNVQHGRFELINTPGQVVLSFLQQQINRGEVQFVHDGSSVAPSYTITASSSANPATTSAIAAQIVFNQNPPLLLNNNLQLGRAQKILLTPVQLNSSVPQTYWPASATFTVDNLQHGYFENILQSGQAVSSFSQLQLNQAQIQFVHDGSSSPPAYSVKVSDPGMTSLSEFAQITFIQNPPILLSNTITIKQGQSIILNNVQFNSFSLAYPDPGSRTITVANIQHGRFDLTTGQGVIAFTQQQIDRGYVRFIHDGSCTAPGYMTILSDPGMTLQPQVGQINFSLLARTLDSNQLTIKQGETLTVDSSQLSATGISAVDTQSLQFLITIPLHIRFSSLSFLQQDIALGKIKVTHDGGALAPSYNVSIINCGYTYGPWSANVIFYPTILPAPSPTTTSNPNESVVIDNALIGGLISGGVGLVFFGLKFYLDYVVKKRFKKTMENSEALDPESAEFHCTVIIPVAERIFSVVSISGICSNTSEEKMSEYKNAVIHLVNELRNAGVNVDLNSMDKLEQSNFLSVVARQTKSYVVPKVDFCSTQNFARFFISHASPNDIWDKTPEIVEAVRLDLERVRSSSVLSVENNPANTMNVPLLTRV
jgi:hypothetical protein